MEQLNKQVEFLEDKSSSGKVRDWSGKKKRNLSLAEIYMMLKEFYCTIHSEKSRRFFNREERCRMCASVLIYKGSERYIKRIFVSYDYVQFVTGGDH